jgi:hypothetical protein
MTFMLIIANIFALKFELFCKQSYSCFLINTFLLKYSLNYILLDLEKYPKKC